MQAKPVTICALCLAAPAVTVIPWPPEDPCGRPRDSTRIPSCLRCKGWRETETAPIPREWMAVTDV
jgi:hypothetical protein